MRASTWITLACLAALMATSVAQDCTTSDILSVYTQARTNNDNCEEFSGAFGPIILQNALVNSAVIQHLCADSCTLNFIWHLHRENCATQNNVRLAYQEIISTCGCTVDAYFVRQGGQCVSGGNCDVCGGTSEFERPYIATDSGHSLEMHVAGAKFVLESGLSTSGSLSESVDGADVGFCDGRYVSWDEDSGRCMPNIEYLGVGTRILPINDLASRGDLNEMAHRMNATGDAILDMASIIVQQNQDDINAVTDHVEQIEQTLLQTLTDRMVEMQAALDEQLGAVTTAVESQLATADETLQGSQADINSLQSANSEQDSTVAELQDVADALSASLGGISDTLDEHAEAIEAAAAAVDPLMAAFEHTPFMDHSLPVYRWAVWSTYNQANGQWYGGNAANLFGGIHPSTWGDGNGHAGQLSGNKDIQRGLFNKRGYMGWEGTVWAEEWYYYSSTNSRHIGALFRIKNTQSRSINWRVTFHYTGWSGWSEQAGVNFNGNNAWNTGNNCGTHCQHTLNFNIPADRTSTIIFVSASNSPSGTRSTFLAFRDNSMRLPDGLEYADDMDYATGSWDQ